MKKIILALSWSALLFSCAKEQEYTDAPEHPTTPEIVKYDSDFSANIDSSAVATKAYFDAADENMLKWTVDDEILVSNGSTSMSYFIKEGGGTNAKLYFTDGTDLSGSAFYAVHPAEGAAYSEGTYTVTIPTTQAYTEGNFAPSAFPMVGCCGAVKALHFKNAGSVLAIRPVSALEGSTITSVTVTANENLVGTCAVTWDGSGDPSVTCNGSNTLTIDCGAGIAWGSTIYACVAPGTYTDLCVTVNYTNSTGSAHYTYRGECVVNRSSIKKMPIDFTYVVDYTDLGATETANCYLITNHEGGKYRFPITVKGNGVTIESHSDYSPKVDLDAVEALYVYYRNGIGECSESIFETEPFLEGDYICFETKAIDAGTPSTSDSYTATTTDAGSALIAISSNAQWQADKGKDSDMGALWSWMVWLNPVVSDHSAPYASSYTFLNMDLGSSTTAFLGQSSSTHYYYQFGRKDPFMSAVSNDLQAPFGAITNDATASLEKSVANPHIFYGFATYTVSGTQKRYDWCEGNSETIHYDWWNANQTTGEDNVEERNLDVNKTMFDPCPPGYHVMSRKAAAALLAKCSSTTTEVRASGTSVGFGNSWQVNFPGYGNRRPSIDNYGSIGSSQNGNGGHSVQRYTTQARTAGSGAAATVMYMVPDKRATTTTSGTTTTTTYSDYYCGESQVMTSFNISIATPIRCQKKQ